MGNPNLKLKNIIFAFLKEIVPLYGGGELWSDEELVKNYLNNTPAPRLQLMGLLAKRSASNPDLLNYLEQEATDPKKLEEVFFGFIKLAWVPVIAVLEHGELKAKRKLSKWVATWPEPERTNIAGYLAKEKAFLDFLFQ